MNEEDEDKNVIKKSGAFYTPQMLVEFVYNEVLPMPSENDCDYNIKILDPACGSGIFLVEGFKRLIERWKFSNKKDELDEKTLRDLLLNNIYGIEIHPEAIKVTAFSLYLTFLHNMNPKKVLEKVRFSPLILWTKDEYNEQIEGKNLLQASTFVLENEDFILRNGRIKSFFKTNFNLVVGNPPWVRGGTDDDIRNFAKRTKWHIGNDIINAYLAYIPTLVPNAKIALISSAKVLFNTTNEVERFRQRFFSEYQTKVIVNLSVVRDVLFEKAKQASALIIYKNRTSLLSFEENVIYCTPKSDKSIRYRKAIAIDASEIKFIPTYEIIRPNSKIFKIGMYGTLRDLKFINKLNKIPNLDELDSVQGMGLIKDKDAKSKGNEYLNNNYFIDTDDIVSYYTSLKTNHPKLQDISDAPLYRSDNRSTLYSAPLILFKEGTVSDELCCSFIDYNCVYKSSVKGIKIPSKNIDYLKALTVCLNSTLARYYCFLISSSWGVDRDRVQKNEISLFPALTEVMPSTTIKALSQKFDEIKNLRSDKENLLNTEEDIKRIQKEIDKLIFEELNIEIEEFALIENVLKYSSVLSNDYIHSGAESPLTKEELNDYAEFYLSVVNRFFEKSKVTPWIEIYENLVSSRNKLICIKINLNNKNQGVVKSSEDISDILRKINKEVYIDTTESIFYRKIIKYKVQNSIYIIKVNQKRFWSKGLALSDADTQIVDLLNEVN